VQGGKGSKGEGISGFRPVDEKHPISCKYGVKGDHWKSGYHQGVDFACPEGSPVRAFEAGTVKIAGNKADGFGIRVVLKHGSFTSLYCHLAEHFVDVGEKIKRGGYFAASGNTGNSTGPHLHFETRTPRGHSFEPVFEKEPQAHFSMEG